MYSKNFFLFIIFVLIVFIYIFSLPPIISTGDGGELITASYGLGIPHPSGYPFYIQLGKIISFLPLCNIGIRVEVLSVFFSALTLYLVYYTVYMLSGKTVTGYFSAIFSVILLCFSYSFFGQSIVAKFYTLNTFLIMLLLLSGIYIVLKGYDRRIQFFASFALGLTLSGHHTGFMMVVPLFILGVFYFRDFIKNLPLSILFLFFGFSINIYLYLRGIKENLFSMIPVNDWKSFLVVFLRKNYEAGSSIDLPKSGFIDFSGYLYAFKNYFNLIEKNFTFFSIPFFIFGLIWLFKKSKKLFIFVFLSFLIYSIFLAKLTFSLPELDSHVVYVAGHQYFIPSFVIYCVITGLGLYFIYSFFEKFNFNLLKKTVPVLVLFFPLLMIFDRLMDQHQGSNYVPYSHTKEIFTSMPVASFYMTYGDNHAFQAWYLKLVGRYREDICHITLDDYKTMLWALQGCKPYKLYRGLFPEFFGGDLIDLTKKKRYYSIIALSEKHPLYGIVDSHPYFYSFIYLPKSLDNQDFAKFFKERMKTLEPFLNYKDCLSHKTDDLFTIYLCRFSLIGYVSIAKAKESLSGKEIVFDQTISYGESLAPFKIKVNVGEENEKYMNIYYMVRKYNDLHKFYLYEGER